MHAIFKMALAHNVKAVSLSPLLGYAGKSRNVMEIVVLEMLLLPATLTLVPAMHAPQALLQVLLVFAKKHISAMSVVQSVISSLGFVLIALLVSL